MSIQPGPVPRFASESRRAWLCSVICVVTTIALSFGSIAVTGLPITSTVFGLLGGYAALSASYAISSHVIFARLDGEEFERVLRATPVSPSRLSQAINGENGTAWAVVLSVFALGSVAVLTMNDGYGTSPIFIGLSGLVVATAWAAATVSYALHYARTDAGRHEFTFPGTPVPRYSDYVYLSVQLSTTLSSSDVEVTTTRLRRAVTRHSVLSFAFNTVIVAVLVSVLLRTVS